MISSLTGQVTGLSEKALTMDVQGVGFEVFATPAVLSGAKIGQPISLRTYLHMKEDGVELYGFSNDAERTFFKQLITISGVGPKSALGILSAASVDEIKRAVVAGDASLLQKVYGVGRKTAERIVVELKEKLELEVLAGTGGFTSGDSGILEALMGLGYSALEAREALRHVPASATEAEDRLKAALKALGKRG